MRVETIGQATLYLGDCLTVLPSIEVAEAVVSDPPYGVPVMVNTGFGKRGGAVKKDGKNWGEFAGNDRPFDPSPWLDFKECLLWGANHFAHRLKENGRWLVWDKRCGVIPERAQADCEMAWVRGYGAARMLRFMWDGICQDEKKGARYHPTEKPEAVMRWCLGFIKSGAVLDPYMGSGSTGVACMQLGKRFTGVEIDPKYFDVACERIENAQRQERLFA
jgi:site-specific DNA-methyltransferase (adenine-specific)